MFDSLTLSVMRSRRLSLSLTSRLSRGDDMLSKCTVVQVKRGHTNNLFSRIYAPGCGAVGCAALPLAQLGLQLARALQMAADELALHDRPERRKDERGAAPRARAVCPPECIERADRFYEPCGGGWVHGQGTRCWHAAAQPHKKSASTCGLAVCCSRAATLARR